MIVTNEIKVEVLDSMGGDLSIVNAARVSFHKFKEKMDDSDVKLIRYLARHKHMSPFRHNQVQLRCSAPIFLARQLGKHQAGLSWNEVSRRYVDEEPACYKPDQWRSRPQEGIKQGSDAPVDNQEDWDFRYAELLTTCEWLYSFMLKYNIAPEQARMVLPQSMMTEWIWTGNLLAFFHVWELRSDKHAQLEAQEFARSLDKVMCELFPIGWNALKEVC